jgi:tripeptide aminopeptidase
VIPSCAYADVDIRSEEDAEIARIESVLRDAVQVAVESSSRAAPAGGVPLSWEITIIGDRPGGVTKADALVVRHAVDATRFCGAEPELVSSSTDANVPMSLGIPSIAIGVGGRAGGMHTTDEWYSNEGGAAGLRRLLLLVLMLAGPLLDDPP